MESSERGLLSVAVVGQQSQLVEQIERSVPPSAQRLRDERQNEFENLAEHAEIQENVVVGDGDIFRSSGCREVSIFVPSGMRKGVLRWVHGLRPCGEHEMKRTVIKLLPRSIGKEPQDGPNTEFQRKVFDVQATAAITENRNLKFLDTVYVFSIYVRAKAIQFERAETTAKTPLEVWTSVFGLVASFLSDGSPNLVRDLARSLTDMLGTGRTKMYFFHRQANGTVER